MCPKIFCGLFLAMFMICWCHAPIVFSATTGSYLTSDNYAKEKVAINISIENIIVEVAQNNELSTKIYPGYTMSFDVAVVSAHTSGQESPIFVYSIFDQDNRLVHKVAEERELALGNVFTKKITLPKDIKPGSYKLNIEAIVGEQTIVQQQMFEVEESPVLALKNTTKSLLANLLEQTRWWFVMVIIIALIILGTGIVMLHNKHHTKPYSN